MEFDAPAATRGAAAWRRRRHDPVSGTEKGAPVFRPASPAAGGRNARTSALTPARFCVPLRGVGPRRRTPCSAAGPSSTATPWGAAGTLSCATGRIVTGPPDSDAKMVDLSGYTCLPGLIDLHAHLTINPDTLTAIDMTRSSAARTLDALSNGRKMLDAGFTTLRTPGEFDGWYGTVDLKKAIARGQHVGAPAAHRAAPHFRPPAATAISTT